MQTLWVDAAEFKNLGGWKKDSQFVRSVGQSYLIACTKPGVPVENATYSFKVEEDGVYRLHVRTKNWKFPEAPGQFALSVDDEELPNILGKMPTHKWYWEIAGDVYLEKGVHTLSAVDKTGWLSRFASIVITNDMDFTPTPEVERMLRQRAQIKGITADTEELHFDFVVIGAGPGGVPAAIEAARNGLKTALISGRPTIGGNASDEGTIGLDGAACRNREAWEGGIANEIRNLHITKKLSWQRSMETLCEREENLTIFVNELCIDAESENNHIVSATTVNTNTLLKKKFSADFFCDCSGDGWLGYYAGAVYHIGREAKWQYGEDFAPDNPDTLSMSGCLCDEQPGMPHMRVFKTSMNNTPTPFTAPDWAIKLPEGEALHRKVAQLDHAEWWLENSNDHDDVWDDEFARDEMIRLGVGYFNWLKNSAPLKPELAEQIEFYELRGLALHNSKRENRRLIGDYVFNQNDCVPGTTFPDAISYRGWVLDVHHPKGVYSGKEGVFYSNKIVPITPVPYRIIYSKNIDNLFMAGRCCSVSHIGLGSIRVESTLATLGQAAGLAASLCKKHSTTPRGIYENHITELQQLLLRHDLTIPGIDNNDPEDLARECKVLADSVADDLYILKIHGAKDGWEEIKNETLTGPCNDTSIFAPEYYKAELKNVSDTAITVKATLYKYSEQNNIAQTLEEVEASDITVPANFEGYIDIPFKGSIENGQFAVSIAASENLFWRKRAWVKQSFFTLERKGDLTELPDQGRELLYSSKTESLADCSPENITNGKNRPTETHFNGWVSNRTNGLPASITLALPEEKEISEVRVTTRVELSYPSYCFKPSVISTGTAEDFTVSLLQNDKWVQVAHITDNCFKQSVIHFEKQKAEAVKITVNKTIDDQRAYITEVRIYE
ncbi:MAG: FAD-dependent oxidoreductase [Clostridia bacterium]|nr:FAD-dependent oxidoreductase [Clostridia bacterium]